MAFLCPVRIRRGKRKKDLDRDSISIGPIGRITGSASIETLVRVGIEKEHGFGPNSKMVVLHDFSPCVDDELDVKRGQVVNVLYQENDWSYVIADSGGEGFIPHSYCALYGTPLAIIASEGAKNNYTQKFTINNNCIVDGDATSLAAYSDSETYGMRGRMTGNGRMNKLPKSLEKSNQNQNISSDETSSASTRTPFCKDPNGRYIVLYTFVARDENDVSVERGEFVTVLNKEDQDWFWVLRSNGEEGFVPSAFVYPAEVVQNSMKKTASDGYVGPSAPTTQHYQNMVAVNPTGGKGDHQSEHVFQHQLTSREIGFQGAELIMLYDYVAQAPDDLNTRRGDWVYADLTNQTVDGWLWAYSPKTRTYGFIPKAYARPPAMMTS